MSIRIIALLLIWLFVLNCRVSAQDYTTVENAPSKLQKQYAGVVENIKLGYFENAMDEIDAMLAREPDFIDAYMLQSEVFYRQGDFPAAAKSMQKALAIDSTYNLRNLYILSTIYAAMDDYKQAGELLLLYGKSTDPDRDEQITIAKLASLYAFRDSLVTHPVGFDATPLPGEVNSPEDEALPAITIDGSRMIFTRYDRRQEDLYVSTWNSDSSAWSKPAGLSGINSSANEGAPSLSADGSVIAFTACGRPGNLGRCDIYVTRRKPDGTWLPARNAEGLNEMGWDGQPALTADGMAMYFASDREGGIGGRDIWYSTFQEDGTWSAPENCGPAINTTGNEESPFLCFDDRTLYFMSDGFPGMGDYDIFRSIRGVDGWSVPQNLGYPINSRLREGGLSIDPDGKTAYFTREEEDGGRMDIFSFELDPGLRPSKTSYAIGLVTDADTGEPLSAKAEVYNINDTTDVHSFYTDKNGVFKASLVHGKEYGLHVTSEGYVFYNDRFSLDSTMPYTRHELFIELQPLGSLDSESLGEPLVLNNIQFAFADSTLLKSSLPELQLVRQMLDDRPDIKVEVRGHTDNIGSEESNMILSEARARAVVNWLISHGVDSDRLSWKGYGESMPVADNGTDIGRRKNRRTELVIR